MLSELFTVSLFSPSVPLQTTPATKEEIDKETIVREE